VVEFHVRLNDPIVFFGASALTASWRNLNLYGLSFDLFLDEAQ
jgi:hypothetical protein